MPIIYIFTVNIEIINICTFVKKKETRSKVMVTRASQSSEF